MHSWIKPGVIHKWSNGSSDWRALLSSPPCRRWMTHRVMFASEAWYVYCRCCDDVSHQASSVSEENEMLAGWKGGGGGEISCSCEGMLLRADDSPRSTWRESTATALRCDCVCFITLGRLGAVHSCEEDFLRELLFVRRKSNKSQRYSGCGSRDSHPGLSPLGAASESYKPALIFFSCTV